MQRLTYCATMFSAMAALVCPGGAAAQDYPTKPVRIITSGVGSGSDFHARLIAQGLTSALGQQVIVENRGSGITTTQSAAKTPNDGYTLLVDSSSLWIITLMQKTNYDPIKDFAPVSILSRSPYVLTAHPSLPVTTVRELVSLAKAQPGQLNYSSGSPGSASYLAAELFKALAGVNIVGVAYASNSQEIADMVSGQVQVTFWGGSRALPLAKAGKVRMLGVSSATPSVLFPGITPIAASGVPGYEYVQSVVLMAPAGTPQPIVQRLNREVVRFLNQADIKQKMLDAGIEPTTSSPDELANLIASSMARMDKVIKAAGMRIQQ